MDAITIPIQVHPDVVFNMDTPGYGGSKQTRASFILSHQIVVLQDLDSSGEVATYTTPKYIACRLANGKIETMDSKHGWLVNEEATQKYIEKQAEDELLK